jgi:hypothetical protein
LPEYLTSKQPYLIEIENQSRKYVLAAKSAQDQYQWFIAINQHVETQSDNQQLEDTARLLVTTEKAIAMRDQRVIHRLLG